MLKFKIYLFLFVAVLLKTKVSSKRLCKKFKTKRKQKKFLERGKRKYLWNLLFLIFVHSWELFSMELFLFAIFLFFSNSCWDIWLFHSKKKDLIKISYGICLLIFGKRASLINKRNVLEVMYKLFRKNSIRLIKKINLIFFKNWSWSELRNLNHLSNLMSSY